MRASVYLLLGFLSCCVAAGAELRIGIVGCDTSHVPALTETFNNSAGKHYIAGGKVVAAYKGGSKDIEASWSRVEGYSKTLKDKYGVTFYDTIEELCRHVDVVLLESVDGRPHLEQVKPVIQAGKPVFIDKPVAASPKEAREIYRLAAEAKVPVFSSSSLRFAKATQAVRNGSIGKVTEVESYGPCTVEAHHPELFWYGVHGVEALFTILGPDCETVQRTTTPEGKIQVVGLWSGGRKGVFREDKDFHGTAKGEKGEAPAGTFDRYVPLAVEIMKFFQTGKAPVQPEETLAIIAFMEAAEASKSRGGAIVRIEDVVSKPAAELRSKESAPASKAGG